MQALYENQGIIYLNPTHLNQYHPGIFQGIQDGLSRMSGLGTVPEILSFAYRSFSVRTLCLACLVM